MGLFETFDMDDKEALEALEGRNTKKRKKEGGSGSGIVLSFFEVLSVRDVARGWLT